MSWKRLENFTQVGDIVSESATRPQLVFKHSTRCSISAAAKYRLEAETAALSKCFDLHYLDLLLHRDVSDVLADRFEVLHQSPQVIIIGKGKAVYSASHYEIEARNLLRLALPS